MRVLGDRNEGLRGRSGAGGAVLYHPPPGSQRLPDESTPGRALVTRRAIADIVRGATLGQYGVAGFAGGVVPAGLRISLRGGGLTLSVRLRGGPGLPRAGAARLGGSATPDAHRR